MADTIGGFFAALLALLGGEPAAPVHVPTPTAPAVEAPFTCVLVEGRVRGHAATLVSLEAPDAWMGEMAFTAEVQGANRIRIERHEPIRLAPATPVVLAQLSPPPAPGEIATSLTLGGEEVACR